MSITSLTTPAPAIAQPRHPGHAASVRPADRSGLGSAGPGDGPEKMRGVRLLAVWIGLTAGAWAVLGGAGYGLYIALHTLLP
ncbi:hypothetical protein A6A40_03335 [Azospirillum humicireducens]|uniref:Uncharacterized protein n=1 Tax=Azospirillum humicireducens TaxID=1226968 RepID=A0A160JE13_9PROT|nr:hypothetical protein [Azospirillum humicireducens]ANC91012.1 hypothetical protein A6A40_03335 [Azospirillum humicireducens]